MGRTDKTLTGSRKGAPKTHVEAVSIALGRLRTSVVLCAWLAGFGLLAQLLIWAAVTNSDLRWQQIESNDMPLVVTSESEVPFATTLDEVTDGQPAEKADPVDPNQVLSPLDAGFRLGSMLAAVVGSICTFLMIPLVALGTLLAASSATDGIDRTVSAFTWSCIVGLLILPVGSWIGLPWGHGALWSYDELVVLIDAQSGAGNVMSSLARYVMLPSSAVIGLVLVATRFSSGVRAGLVRAEMLALDPELEREAANMKSTSLHGGRTAAAFAQATATIARQNDQDQQSGDQAPPTGPDVQTSSGEAPRRII